jgi:protein TonB
MNAAGPRRGFLLRALFCALALGGLPAWGQVVGNAGPQAAASGAGPTADAEMNSALELYRALLMQTGSKLRIYPEDALRRGQTGRVIVHLSIGADGKLESEELLQSSGYPALDRSALDMLARAVPLTEIPAALHNIAFEMAFIVKFVMPGCCTAG